MLRPQSRMEDSDRTLPEGLETQVPAGHAAGHGSATRPQRPRPRACADCGSGVVRWRKRCGSCHAAFLVEKARRLSAYRRTLLVYGFKAGHGPAWKGGTKRTAGGYILRWARGRGYVREHRLVVEEAIGRPLRPDEIVHHINGVRDDNRPENLQLTSRTEHQNDLHPMPRNGYGQFDQRGRPWKRKTTNPCSCGCGATARPGRRFLAFHHLRALNEKVKQFGYAPRGHL